MRILIICLIAASLAATCALTILRWTGVIAWHWLWILAPAWGLLAVAALLLPPACMALRWFLHEGRNIP
jgi:hypothetical protein